MEPNVPAGAVPLLDLIRRTETGRQTPAEQYATIIGHKEDKLAKPVTEMTLDELQADMARWRKNWKTASTAAGGYQIIKATLQSLMVDMGLPSSVKFTPNVQDRMAFQLLKRRGWSKFVAGQITLTAFGNELAREWASLPVMVDGQGAHREVKAGQSYYAGDGVNKALVSVETVRNVLGDAMGQVLPHPAPTPATRDPTPPEAGLWAAIVRVVLAVLKALGKK